MVTELKSARRLAACILAAASAVGSVMVASAAGPAGTLAQAAAAPCPPVEVMFARGRNEPPGIGRLGQPFVDALQARVPNVGVYAVNYPADTQFWEGANDISRHIQYMADACPDTRLIVGGYSLGAAAATVALSNTKGSFGFTDPLPPGVDSHVAAVVLFGNISHPMGAGSVGPAFRDKTFDACNAADPICSGGLPQSIQDLQRDWSSHLQPAYIDSGLVDQAADFAAARVQ